MESDRQFSLHVSRALDVLGKSQEMIKFRVDHYAKWTQYPNSMVRDLAECIVPGSKGEGLTSPYESDYDVMVEIYGVICADNIVPFRHVNGITLFEADVQNTSPGYTILRLDKFEGLPCRNWIQQSLFKACSGQLYFSSDYFIDRSLKKSLPYITQTFNSYRSGPSQTSVAKSDPLLYSTDWVPSFYFSCLEITQSFVTRPRDHEWPTNDQLTQISTLESHVVPIGYKGSETAFLEWRICYTKAERFLMHSLNDTQTKTYILLKMVSKTYISFVCKDITSYVLKNIVLWMAECCYLDSFKENLLVDRLIQALIFLRACVVNNNLPSYMIPERNLFSGKLDLAKRQKLVILLTDLIDEDGGLLMGCDRLGAAMIVLYKEPAKAEHYRQKKDMIEKVWLLLKGVPSRSDYRIQLLYDIILQVALPLILQGCSTFFIYSKCAEQLTQWLS